VDLVGEGAHRVLLGRQLEIRERRVLGGLLGDNGDGRQLRIAEMRL